MKNIILLLSLYILFTNDLKAQCSGCTSTISTTENFPQVVGAGMKLCISSSGVLNGSLVINGGEVCNSGTINSNDIALIGGSLENIGIINSLKLAITSGDFNNQGDANIDSVLVDGSNILVTNIGSLTLIDLGMSKSGSGVSPQLYNSGLINITNLGIYTGAIVNNSGDLIISNDFGCYFGASLNNLGYMSVGNDFGNEGTFYTECMIPVGNDWGNTGVITGPFSAGCGGFTVTNLTGNSGSFAIDNSNLDMCDLGNPVSGFDGNTGSLGTGVSYCSCSNNCSSVLTILEISLDTGIKIHPNPISNFSILEFIEIPSDKYSLAFFDALGHIVLTLNEVHNGEHINRDQFEKGIYFFQLKSSNGEISNGKILVQ